jgi:TonB-dependent SusC/RagA subfamily outer membrane receptor
MKQIICLWFFLCFLIIQTFAQESNIKGKVTNASDGTPLQGVSVSANTTARRIQTTTNAQGEFTITVPVTTKELVFSYVGMTTLTEKIDGRKVLSVQLTSQSAELDQVVVTALGIKREARALSFSQQSVDVNSLNETKDPNIVNSLSGKIAGVQVVPSGLNTGSARIVIRGNKSLTGNNQPLFVIDGMPIDNTPGDAGSIDYGGGAGDINPADIESMEVLKGPNAAALYGSRAQNGVILLPLKKAQRNLR